MFGTTVKVENNFKRVAEKEKRGTAKSILHGAAIVRRVAQQSIVRTAKSMHSSPGSPVFTHQGTWFKRSILFAADKDIAVVGPSHSKVGEVGYYHEFGRTRRGTKFPERPTMGPALENSLHRFADGFRNSIGV